MSEQPFFSCRCGNTVWRGDRPRFVLHIFERREDGGYNDTRLACDTAEEAIAEAIAAECDRDHRSLPGQDETAMLAKVILAMDALGQMPDQKFVAAAEEFLEGGK